MCNRENVVLFDTLEDLYQKISTLNQWGDSIRAKMQEENKKECKKSIIFWKKLLNISDSKNENT
jgi:hypothetical protein